MCESIELIIPDEKHSKLTSFFGGILLEIIVWLGLIGIAIVKMYRCGDRWKKTAFGVRFWA